MMEKSKIELDSTTLRQRIVFRRLIQLLIITAIFLMGINTINHENDIFWQLKMGEQIWEKQTFPVKDPYSLPAQGEVWTLEEWLPNTMFYVLFKHFGAPGLIIMKATTVAITFGLFLHLLNKMKVNLYLSLITLFLAAMVNTRGVWVVFPSIFEYLLIVLTLYLLEAYHRYKSKTIPWFLGFLAVLWPHVHASFFLLTGMLAIYIVGNLAVYVIKIKKPNFQPVGNYLEVKELKPFVAVFLLSLVTPIFTPNGFWTWAYPFRIAFGDFTYYVSEYQRFWVIWQWNWSDFVHGFTLILMAILGLLFFVSRKRVHPGDVLLALFYAILAFTAVRHVAIFALVALYLIGRYISVWFGEYRGLFKRSLVKDVALIIIIGCFVFYYKTRIIPFGFTLSEGGYPKDAAELVMSESIPPGNMFNHYNFGGYLIWKMPGHKVFIDGRLEMYQGRIGQEYLTILEAREGYEKLLEKYRINFVITYLTDQISEKLSENPDWRHIQHDSQYALFVRKAPENERVIGKYWSPEKEQAFKDEYKPALAKFKAEYLNNRALEAVRKKDYWSAIADFQEAVNVYPESLVTRFNLIRAYLELGLGSEAKKEYQRILEMDPQNEQAKKGLFQLETIEKQSILNIY